MAKSPIDTLQDSIDDLADTVLILKAERDALLEVSKALIDLVGEGHPVGEILPIGLYNRFLDAVVQAEKRKLP